MDSSKVRQIKLDSITGTPNEIVEWFNVLLNGLISMEANVYHSNGNEFIYYKQDSSENLVIFYIDYDSDIFWCASDNYWSVLESLFGLDYHEVRAITNFFTHGILIKSLSTPDEIRLMHHILIENTLNNKINGV